MPKTIPFNNYNFVLRISSFLFCLLVLFLPTQLGRHFFPNFSFVSGIRVDYLSPTLYLTDIIIFILFVIWICSKSKISNIKYQISNIRHNSLFGYWKFVVLVVFVVFLIFGILLSKNQAAGWYGFLKLLEFVFLGFYTAHNFKKLKFNTVLLLFSIGIIFESFLAIFQYVNQGSIGGIFYFFGERTFNAQTPGIANASVNGELVLRPYGTFSHPNVLAGYLTIAMAMVISNFKFQISNFKKTLYLASLTVGTVALFLTMSRIAILLWLVIVGFQAITYVRKNIRLLVVLVFIVSIGSILLLSPLRLRFSDIRLTDESITQRGELIRDSFSMIKSHPIFGVGLNNFLVELPSVHKQDSNVFYLQPVHNIYLLILAQTGIVGLIFFLWFIFKTYQNLKAQISKLKATSQNLKLQKKDNLIINPSSLIIILSLILIMGLFDHYFLTLQQGQLLFAFVMGLCWLKKN